MEVVMDFPEGTTICPEKSTMIGLAASNRDTSVAGLPVGAAVEVLAVITLVNALPKL
jgi:hypothetical protein